MQKVLRKYVQTKCKLPIHCDLDELKYGDCFEIVYDTKQTMIIGFVPVDKNSLKTAFDKDTNKNIWVQYKNNKLQCRVLYDTQILFFKYDEWLKEERTKKLERICKTTTKN